MTTVTLCWQAYRNRRRSHFREFRINKQIEFSSPDGNFYDEQNAPIIFGWGSAPDPPLAISRCPQRPHSRTGRWTPHSRGLWVPMTPFLLRTASRSEPPPPLYTYTVTTAVYCYKIVFELVHVIYNVQKLFSEQVINVGNSLPPTVNFISLAAFKHC